MSDGGVDAVERALSILSAFETSSDALSLAELAARTGLYKSTILRLIVSLERFQFILRDGNGRYRLGAELWRLGMLCGRTFDFEPIVRPVLSQLVEETGETASFFIRQGAYRLCLYRLNSMRAARHHLDEGVRLPLDRGAAGRVLLAFADEPGSPYERIRRNGCYTSHGERDPDITAVAVPVRDAGGAIRGALAVSGLRSRFNASAEKKALAALRKGTDQLSKDIPVIGADVGRLDRASNGCRLDGAARRSREQARKSA